MLLFLTFSYIVLFNRERVKSLRVLVSTYMVDDLRESVGNLYTRDKILIINFFHKFSSVKLRLHTPICVATALRGA